MNDAVAFHKGKLCKLVVCFVCFDVDLLRILHSIRLHVDPVQLPLYKSSSVHVIVIHGFFLVFGIVLCYFLLVIS